jgi:hypothetical protein
MKKSNLARVRQCNILAGQNYGATHTIGARQTAIMYDIFRMNQNGIPVKRETLALRHPAHALNGNSFESLRARGLIKGSGGGWTLTAAGLQVVRSLDKSNAAVGLGFVAVGVPSIR